MSESKPEEREISGKEELYPIRTVSRLTGVNSITLRAWERRYGLIKPVRTPKGHRLYSQADIDLIQQVLELLDKGISIGQVKGYLHGQAAKITDEKSEDPWSSHQQRMINAVVRFDANALDQAYNEALSLYPIDLVTKHLILPLLITLGRRWAENEGSIAEEHFFGAYLRNKLGARFHHHPGTQNGPLIVAACLPGEQHEIGLMLFCLSALNQGYRLIYLGADTPYGELVTPVQRSHADALLLSGSVETDPKDLDQGLSELLDNIGVPVFVGGKTAIKYSDNITSAGAIPLGTDITQALSKMNEIIAATS